MKAHKLTCAALRVRRAHRILCRRRPLPCWMGHTRAAGRWPAAKAAARRARLRATRRRPTERRCRPCLEAQVRLCVLVRQWCPRRPQSFFARHRATGRFGSPARGPNRCGRWRAVKTCRFCQGRSRRTNLLGPALCRRCCLVAIDKEGPRDRFQNR